MTNLPFAVETNGSAESKEFLVGLYEKYVGPVTSRYVMVKKNSYPVLVFKNDDVYHSQTTVDGIEDSKLVSFEEAVNSLINYKKFQPITVKLNTEYTAIVQHDGSVKVGCQTISKTAIKELIAAVNSVDNR